MGKTTWTAEDWRRKRAEQKAAKRNLPPADPTARLSPDETRLPPHIETTGRQLREMLMVPLHDWPEYWARLKD